MSYLAVTPDWNEIFQIVLLIMLFLGVVALILALVFGLLAAIGLLLSKLRVTARHAERGVRSARLSVFMSYVWLGIIALITATWILPVHGRLVDEITQEGRVVTRPSILVAEAFQDGLTSLSNSLNQIESPMMNYVLSVAEPLREAVLMRVVLGIILLMIWFLLMIPVIDRVIRPKAMYEEMIRARAREIIAEFEVADMQRVRRRLDDLDSRIKTAEGHLFGQTAKREGN